MAYTRAVWYEDLSEQVFSGVVLSKWIIDNNVYWPPKGKDKVYFDRKEEVNLKTWRKFSLIKMKLRTDDPKAAQDVADTSEAPASDDELGDSVRQRKEVQSNDFVRLDDYESPGESDNESSASNQKGSCDISAKGNTGLKRFFKILIMISICSMPTNASEKDY